MEDFTLVVKKCSKKRTFNIFKFMWDQETSLERVSVNYLDLNTVTFFRCLKLVLDGLGWTLSVF